MSKRKAGVNDIIYELDNEDIEVSSDDEVKEAKINRLEPIDVVKSIHNEETTKETCVETINIDSSCEIVEDNSPSKNIHNGGKMTCDLDNGDKITISPQQTEIELDNKKLTTDCVNTTILNEDIVIDSPGNSDLGVEGCENRTPLLTVRFRDKKLASTYKKQIKAFMLNLIQLHGDNLESGSETDMELDIWPEDLNDEPKDIFEENNENNLFFVDTDPCADVAADIPRYSQMSTLISNIPDKEPSPPPLRRGPICFNCDGKHPLRDCQLPRDNARIAEKRKNMAVRVGRYHVEDEQKYGHLIPGRISGQLRHALGLKRHELPLHIYRMRLLGYPHGWLEEARISHSGITMFDSTGTAILEPEEEEGEVCEPGSKDKFDIKKILDFPGFNVPASPRYKEEAHVFGLPPMSDQDSKMAMLQVLAPNAMKAYKRKKLTFFPSATTGDTTQEGQAEMELDSGDEIAEFPSIPPLPDEAPPPPPPPPECPPPPPSPPPPDKLDDKMESSGDDVEVVEVIKVVDIPVPTADFITIDEDDDKSQSSGRASPSLDDLEQKKRLLLDALEGETTQGSADVSISDATETEEDIDKSSKVIDDDIEKSSKVVDDDIEKSSKVVDDSSSTLASAKVQDDKTDHEGKKTDVNIEESKQSVEAANEDASMHTFTNEIEPQSEAILNEEVVQEPESSPIALNALSKGMIKIDNDICRTPENKTGHVKTTKYGTPVMNIASSYVKLPSDEKFSKDICDIINFENLPNSTGKYKQISVLLRKVKSEVDRIQES